MTSAASVRSSVIGVTGTSRSFFLTGDFHHLDSAASPRYIRHRRFCDILGPGETFAYIHFLHVAELRHTSSPLLGSAFEVYMTQVLENTFDIAILNSNFHALKAHTLQKFSFETKNGIIPPSGMLRHVALARTDVFGGKYHLHNQSDRDRRARNNVTTNYQHKHAAKKYYV
jgi:hypothetical protein